MHVNHTYLSQGIINSMKDIIARQPCLAQSQTIIKLAHSSIIGHQCAPVHYRNRSRLIAEEHMAKIADVFNGVSLAINDLKHFYWPDDVTNSRKSWSANEGITWLIRHDTKAEADLVWLASSSNMWPIPQGVYDTMIHNHQTKTQQRCHDRCKFQPDLIIRIRLN